MKSFLPFITAICLAHIACTINAQTADIYVRDSLFTNPVYSRDCPDPTVWKDEDRGLFYCTATGKDRELLSSTDLVTWIAQTSRRVISVAAKTEAVKVGKQLWAPGRA